MAYIFAADSMSIIFQLTVISFERHIICALEWYNH